MPELPEVETVRRGLEPVMAGRVITQVTLNRPDLRFPLPPRFRERLVGQRITALGRRAKYLLADLSSGEVLLMHLGMSGRFLIREGTGPAFAPGEFHIEAGGSAKHDHVIFTMEGGATVTYNDARRFGFMDLVPRAELATSRHMKAVGVEPLGNELSGALLARLFDGKAAPLKAALLDQTLVAGLGNIYVCEALFRARLSPTAPAGSIVGPGGRATPQADLLAATIRDVLAEAVEAGGSTLRDFAQADGSLGYFQHRFRVYDREGEPCATEGCADTVTRLVQSGRSTFYCPTCQGVRARRRGAR